ncbi:MAG TPA: hypothetical protein VGL77_12325 [Armatimonadota bacterium]|jgi:osmotically-inducible protein OsmY
MGVEDKRIYRLVEHELHRYQNIDLEEVRVTVTNGIVYIGGVLRPAVGMHYINIKEEARIIGESMRKVPGMRDLVIDAKLDESPRK